MPPSDTTGLVAAVVMSVDTPRPSEAWPQRPDAVPTTQSVQIAQPQETGDPALFHFCKVTGTYRNSINPDNRTPEKYHVLHFCTVTGTYRNSINPDNRTPREMSRSLLLYSYGYIQEFLEI
jgi:hypothetical protein